MTHLPPALCACARCTPAAGAKASVPAAAPQGAQDLAGLIATGVPLRQLEADGETLAMVLPLFDRISATTVGPHALLSQRGGYGPAQIAGRPPRRNGTRMLLRLASGRGEILVHSDADAASRRPAALHLFSALGQILHRTEIATPEDLSSLAAISRQLDAGTAPEAGNPAPSLPHVVSLPALRASRAGWWYAQPHVHQDQILLDGGRNRSAILPHLGIGANRRIDPRALTGLLQYLAQRQLPFSRAVVRPGCLHEQQGSIQRAEIADDLLLLPADTGLMAFDPKAVAQCWLTRWGMGPQQQSVLELYDQAGACLAILRGADGHGQHGCHLGARPDDRSPGRSSGQQTGQQTGQPNGQPAVQQEWARLLASLPDAPRPLASRP